MGEILEYRRLTDSKVAYINYYYSFRCHYQVYINDDVQYETSNKVEAYQVFVNILKRYGRW